MKKLISSLLISSLVLPTTVFAVQHEEISRNITHKDSVSIGRINSENKQEYKEEELIEFSLMFLDTTFSDFANIEEYKEDLINEHSFKLKQYVIDRRKINNLKQDLSNRKFKLLNRKVTNTKVTELNDNMYEVLADIDYSYMDGDLKASLEAGYKIVVESKGNSLKVVAAISNDLSGGTLNNKLIIQSSENLDLNYQLNDIQPEKLKANTNIDAKYDINEIENNLLNYFNEIKNEKVASDVEDTTIKTSANAKASFVSFSNRHFDAMKKYQDNYYATFNPAYAKFSSDCTNYASQILRSGGAPMYTASLPGISRTNKWFYRSLNDRSTSWTGVNEMRKFLLNNTTKGPRGIISSTYSALTPGSIIQLGSNDEFWHTIIVYNQGGDPWVTAHTKKYSGYYSARYSGNASSKILISGYYQ